MKGGRIWYRRVGMERKNIPLIILHGGPGGCHDAYEPLEALSDERPVVFYDQLGCGNSDKPEDDSLWTIDRYAEELAQLRQSLKLERSHLLGHSWGATLAAHYMISYRPAGIVSLTLSSPFLSGPLWEKDQRRFLSKMPSGVRRIVKGAAISRNFSSKKYQNAVMKYYRKHICRLDPWPECLKISFSKTALNVYEYMWGPSEITITGTLKDYDCTERLKRIRVPTLFLCGKYDEASPGTTANFNSKLPGSELVVFQRSSHMTFLEQTNDYLKVLRTFMMRSEKRYRGGQSKV